MLPRKQSDDSTSAAEPASVADPEKVRGASVLLKTLC